MENEEGEIIRRTEQGRKRWRELRENVMRREETNSGKQGGHG